MRPVIVVSSIVALAGCALERASPPLVSAQSPPGTGSVNANSAPQSLNSLPEGAANLSRAPGATEPDFGAIRLRAF